jgi:putative copper export protein
VLSELTWIIGSAVASALLIVGLSGVLGTLVCGWLLRGREGSAARQLSSIGVRAAFSVLIAAVLRVWLQCAALAESPSAWLTMLGPVLLESQLGAAMLVQALAALLAATGFLIASRYALRGRLLCVVAAMALTLAPGLGGHPAAHEQRLLAMLTSFVHVTGVGAWLGTLAVLTLGTRRLSDEDLARAVQRFHRVATIGIAAVVLSGAVKLWDIAPEVASLGESSWGVSLTVKLAAFLVVAALGYRHWRGADVALAAGKRRNTIRSFTLELLFALLALGATSVLVNSAPPDKEAVVTAVRTST